MQFASFDPGDPVFDAFGFALSLQIATLENVYGLDPASTRADLEDGAFVIRCARLAFAGQQRHAEGSAEIRVEREGPTRVRVGIRAHAPTEIRCVKLVWRGLEAPLELLDGERARGVGPQGEILAYPNRLPAPLLCVGSGAETLALRCEDRRVREKRFALATERLGPFAGHAAIEVVHEEDATCFAPTLEAAPILLARGASPDAWLAEHLAFLERECGLLPFAARRDVPAWTRELRLVATLHGMHWTGRVFLDYAAMLDTLRFIAARIDGRHVLAYLPGWEGRYYWQYGEYRPEPALGGEAGFARLCDGARALGVHVMPMFGANCVNASLPRFRDLDASAYMKSATRNRFHGNQPDWDFTRAHDTGWQAWLNPGHPGWRETLAAQIESLARRFGFDGVFLDTIHVFVNDPDHGLHDGIAALVARLRASLPGVVLAAEHDWDRLLPLFPLFQRAYWGRDPEWTRRYALRFGHLCEGEPEGRTGVHEFGVFRNSAAPPAERSAPGYVATLAFQDDTLARNAPAIEAALEAAAAYRAEPS